MSYTTSAVTHYHPCEVQHIPHNNNNADYVVSSNNTILYEPEIPSSTDQASCETPLPLSFTADSDSDSTTSSSTSSSRKTSKKHHKRRRSHRSSSSSSSSRANSLMVPENVKRQGDIAIHDILAGLQKRQDSFGMLSTTHYNNDGYGAHYDDDNNDDNGNDCDAKSFEDGEDDDGTFRTVHHQGLTPELRREMLGPHGLRQHHGCANLRHG
ncbi:hypothetical protein BG015_002324 [Linnemannia schmuckeri]|uniref:Uncharacterized protein n=1 Tax=Linnemannia schmuckeri TaxID=64567 RepID=A0A9P5RP69_9FUNG|nr:hypothetical protein BG015_002324 [Linnemannia schmuckeri]